MVSPPLPSSPPLLHQLLLAAFPAIPAYGSLKAELSPFSSIFLLGLASCLSLKLVSYAQVPDSKALGLSQS